MARMSRTTIMAEDELLDRLRAIARTEGVSLGEVIREGLEWRAALRSRPPSFVGAVSSAEAHDLGRTYRDVLYPGRHTRG